MNGNRPFGILRTNILVLDRILKAASRFCLNISAVIMALLLISYVFEVISRYFLNSPTTWSFDLGKALMSTMVILALPEVTHNRGNITIDIFLEGLRPKTRLWVKRTVAILCFAICLTTAWLCLDTTIQQYRTGIETFWNNPIPKWWISMFIPFGFTLSALNFLMQIWSTEAD